MAREEGIRLNRDGDVSITVDVQPTFMPGGGLPVPGGDEIVATVLRCEGLFLKERRFATLDRHPRGHISLASSYFGIAPGHRLTSGEVRGWGEDDLIASASFGVEDLIGYLDQVGAQVLWPDHAIEGSEEARFHRALWPGRYAHVQAKGTDPLCDSYSGLADALGRPTGLGEHLAAAGAKRVFIWGLAFDFCVGWTAIDAAKLGYEAYVVRDATRSVDLPGSIGKMEADLAAAGARLIVSSDLSL